MRMATTSGLAGWNLCGRSAAGLAGLGFGCGGHEESFLGVAPDSANLRLENHVSRCAPSLLKRIATVGGASEALQRETTRGIWGTRRRALSAGFRFCRRTAAHLRIRSGKGGGLVSLGNGSRQSPSSTAGECDYRAGTFSRHKLRGVGAALWELTGIHTAARLLQLCPRRRCRPAPAADGAYRMQADGSLS